ncbi:MAG: hypothetical protein Q9219_006996 [cf. Caloplaca sp. 3 TL-2023]
MGSLPPPVDSSFGQRLLPTLIDERSKERPDDVYALVPRSMRFIDGMLEITYATLAKTIDGVAYWLQQNLGKSKTFETIAYMGPADLRYYIVALAATKTLYPSPRNSIEGTQALLEKTQCRTLITSSEVKVEHLLTENGPRHLVIADLTGLISKGSDAPYPYGKTYEEARNDPFLVVHTSGSTGLPKPVVLYHGGLATVDKQQDLPPAEGDDSQMGAILYALVSPLYFDQTIIWPPSGRPVSADLIDDALDHIQCDMASMGPSVIEELSQSQASLDRLRRIEYLGFGGGKLGCQTLQAKPLTSAGPLSKTAGDTVAQYCKILDTIGSSESSLFPIYRSGSQDWQYFHYPSHLKGLQFRHVDADLHEMVFIRHPSTDPYHSTWYTFPELEEYNTHDLYLPHPSKKNLWLYAGRSDDLIVLSNGEKLNPSSMQGALLSHPEVKGALIVGQARFEPVALIELRHEELVSVEEREAFDQSFRPYIDKANENTPSYAKLLYDHVMFTKPDEPMLRADKGTVKRSATLKVYAQDIDEFYNHLESANNVAGYELDTKDHDSLVESLNVLIAKYCDLGPITPDHDLFGLGMNSLQAMAITRVLKSSITAQNERAARGVSAKLVYSNPTLSKLASAIQALLNPSADLEEDTEGARIKEMERLVEEFSAELPSSDVRKPRSIEGGHVVLLTGSTGSLGSYMLDVALTTPDVKKVICLNRRAHSQDQQSASHAARGLIHDWHHKVEFLQADLSKPRLGLDEDRYSSLVEEVSLIIHNQYPVDFNLVLSSFKPQLTGVRNLIDFSAASSLCPRILFTSSISTVANWNAKFPGVKVPEAPFHDFTIPAPTGYGMSKYIGERLLENAARISSVPVTIVRVGQLGGPVVKEGGMWNKQEWLPSVSSESFPTSYRTRASFWPLRRKILQIIASSVYLHKVPSSLAAQDDIAWVPVDLAAKALVELGLSSSSTHDTYNLTNPRPSSWSHLVPLVQTHLSKDHSPVDVVDFDTWVKALGESAEKSPEDVDRNPGIKLLDFYEGLSGAGSTVLETRETEGVSGTVKGLGTVGEEWMRKWLEQWDF